MLLACTLTPSSAILLPRQTQPSLEPLCLGGRSGVSTSVWRTGLLCHVSGGCFADFCSELRGREEAAPALLYLEPPCLHSMIVVTGTCRGRLPGTTSAVRSEAERSHNRLHRRHVTQTCVCHPDRDRHNTTRVTSQSLKQPSATILQS